MAMDTGYVADVNFFQYNFPIHFIFKLETLYMHLSVCVRLFSFQVAKHYYRFQNSDQKIVGSDVLALDILRGRDHGLAGYTKYLQLCTKQPIESWTDLKRFINDEV